MTNADHPPEGRHPWAEAGLADALESMAQRGADLAPPHERAYSAVRGRVRARRAAKATGAGMMSVAAVAVVGAGLWYGPPDHKGYAPGVSGFTHAPSVPGFGKSATGMMLEGHQPRGWQGTLLACGARLSEVLGAGSPSSGDQVVRSADYGLQILDARQNTLVVRRAVESLADDVLVGQVTYVWTKGDRVVSLPDDFMAGELAAADGRTRYDSPSPASTCMADEQHAADRSRDSHDAGGTVGSDVEEPGVEGNPAAAVSPPGPKLPAGTYELRAYQYLVPAGTESSTATVDASITDPASWSAPVEVEVTEDGAVVPVA